MAGAGADAELLVRTMDQVARHAQGQLVRPQRIVRARRHHGRQRIAIGGVLGADRGRRIPGRVLGLGGDAGVRDRRTPALAADAQRIGVHHVLPFRVVVQAVLGQVDHHAFARARRQHEAGRDDHLGADARQPGIDARVGGDHFAVAQVVLLAEVGERVLVLGLDHLDLADDVLARRRELQFQGRCGAGRKQRGERQ